MKLFNYRSGRCDGGTFSIPESSCDLKGNYAKNPNSSECEGMSHHRIPSGGHASPLGRAPLQKSLDSFQKCIRRAIHKSMGYLPGKWRPSLFILPQCPQRGLPSEQTLCISEEHVHFVQLFAASPSLFFLMIKE